MSDGHCVYQGEAKLSAKYFRNLGFTLPTFSNPADTYMRILAVNFPKTAKDEAKLRFFNKHYDRALKPAVQQQNDMVVIKLPNLEARLQDTNTFF